MVLNDNYAGRGIRGAWRRAREDGSPDPCAASHLAGPSIPLVI